MRHARLRRHEAARLAEGKEGAEEGVADREAPVHRVLSLGRPSGTAARCQASTLTACVTRNAPSLVLSSQLGFITSELTAARSRDRASRRGPVCAGHCWMDLARLSRARTALSDEVDGQEDAFFALSPLGHCFPALTRSGSSLSASRRVE